MNNKLPENMQYSCLVKLRNEHPAWRLLASEQCSFVASFLYQEFMVQNQRAIPEDRLLEDLNNYIYHLHDNAEAEDIIRPAKDYLASWTDAQHSWLRKFYLGRNTPYYDLTAAAQRGLQWLAGLHRKSFIGTESRVRLVFNLIREIAEETNRDPKDRIEYLKGQRADIDHEIEYLENGGVPATIDDIQVKDRYIHAAETARSILADFREVEENFRRLESHLMEQIVTWKKGKGELLDQFFRDRDYIQNSEQGRSFMAFWEYLMKSSSDGKLDKILEQVLALDGIDEIEQQYDMRHIRRQWSEAARQVMDTISNLSRQLSRYVDEGGLEQEKYIYELIKGIEDKALNIKDRIPRDNDFCRMDQTAPAFDFVMDRHIYVPPRKPVIHSSAVHKGTHDGSVEALFKQVYVDRRILENNVNELLKDRDMVTLNEVLDKYPLKNGLTELLGYLVIASSDSRSFVDGERQKLEIENIETNDVQVDMDRIVFYKKGDDK